jgi:hypothetical protein
MVVVQGEECFQLLVGIKCEPIEFQQLRHTNEAARIRHGCDPKTGERVRDDDEDQRGDGDFDVTQGPDAMAVLLGLEMKVDAVEPTADCCGAASVVVERDDELERYNERKAARGMK